MGQGALRNAPSFDAVLVVISRKIDPDPIRHKGLALGIEHVLAVHAAVGIRTTHIPRTPLNHELQVVDNPPSQLMPGCDETTCAGSPALACTLATLISSTLTMTIFILFCTFIVSP